MIQNLNQFPTIPALIPKPEFCFQIDKPIICLDGQWKFLQTPDPEHFAVTPGTDGYRSIQVPSWNDSLRQPDFCGAYLYKTTVSVTPEMANSRVVLRMEGVNGFASIYINGIKIATHKNAFLTWNTEITDKILGCSSFELAVCVDEREEAVSAFGHGGLCHSVFLYLLPPVFFRAVHTTTIFDETFTQATLQIDYSIEPFFPNHSSEVSKLVLRSCLTDPYGDTVAEGCFEKPIASFDTPTRLTQTCSINKPYLWDAEHPRLYTLTLELWAGDTKLERICHPFGFRQIQKQGNQLFINGNEVKLRGSCRHETTARNGRCLTPELIEEDVRLFKEANCNYIRTSHYPPSEYFLTLCDRYGIYVEDEMALAFIARTLDYTQQDPLQTQRYLSHFADLVSRDYSHPSVIIWSLCNESFGGVNFDLLNRFAKSTDPTRVTKFSYPMTMREEYEPFDIWSIHYSNYDTDLAERRDNVSVGGAFGKTMPVIHDEYVHVPCYNRTEHRRDPYVREFWGQSLARFWTKIWHTKGALGGAIWAGIDETDIYDGGSTCLEWGIIDVWRRKKPEHYAVRKAYSPIVLYGVNPLTQEIASEWDSKEKKQPAKPHIIVSDHTANLVLHVENRFCHTNLNETKLCGWFLKADACGDGTIEDCCQAKSHALSSILLTEDTIGSIAPFASGDFSIPINLDADFLYLEWFDACDKQVDEFLLPLKTSEQTSSDALTTHCTDSSDSVPILVESSPAALTIQIPNDQLCIVFDSSSGLIQSICQNGKPAILSGPTLHVPYLKLPDWELDSFSFQQMVDHVFVTTHGHYGASAAVTWQFTITSNGSMHIQCTIDQLSAPLPRQIKLRVGVDCGGLDEIGFTLETAPGADRICWSKNSDWSIYPEYAIGRRYGTALKGFGSSNEFGTKPEVLWKDDCRHDVLNGRYDPGISGSNDFCATKPNLYHAVIDAQDGSIAPIHVAPCSSMPLHLRAEVGFLTDQIVFCQDLRIHYTGTWYAMTDCSYESSGHEMWSNQAGAKAELSFVGTGIVWYAPVDVNYGQAKVFIDQKQVAIINQRIDGVDFPGSSAGFDKKYHYPVFSVTNLPEGPHTLTIEVLGSHAADSCDSYIVLEEFRILTANTASCQPVLLHLLKDYNFPHLSWGNWIKPAICPSDGEQIEAILQF